MPKNKIKANANQRNYLYIVIGFVFLIVSVLMIGRVGMFDTLYLLIMMLSGDYTIFILLLLIFYCVKSLILNKKIDLHHIYFLGFIFIYIGLSIFSHLGLYDSLHMSYNNIISKTIDLYSRYFNNFNHSYSCGGGIISALILQIIIFISGKVGSILFSITFIFIGISYLIDFKILDFLKGGKLKRIPPMLFRKIKYFFKEIKYPVKKQASKIPISLLKDNDEKVSFTLQNEINKETFNALKSYITKNHIYCVCDSYITSYTSSRFIIKLAHKKDGVLREISAFFNKCCFYIKNDQYIKIEISNQFKKLLTLKSLLLREENNSKIILGIDIDNTPIDIDIRSGKSLLVVGDYTSGVKTFIRCFLSSILYKGYKMSNIYFYDMFNEFNKLSYTGINYVYNERLMIESFELAFIEYEKRIDTFKYLNADSLIEANKKISEMGSEYELLSPIFHIIFLNSNNTTNDCLKRLNYLLQFGIKVGMIIIIIARDKSLLNKLELCNSDLLSFYLTDLSTSINLLGSDIACRLQKKGDFLYQSKNKIYHGQSPYVSLDDFEKIINHI